MQYNIVLNMTLDLATLQTILQTLDNGPHRVVRGLIDTIVAQVREQDLAAQPPADTELGAAGTD